MANDVTFPNNPESGFKLFLLPHENKKCGVANCPLSTRQYLFCKFVVKVLKEIKDNSQIPLIFNYVCVNIRTLWTKCLR